MEQIASRKHSMEPEAFIPTFRRADFLFKMEGGQKFRLIATMSWKGTPHISLMRVAD
jgi:hypothetical protein